MTSTTTQTPNINSKNIKEVVPFFPPSTLLEIWKYFYKNLSQSDRDAIRKYANENFPEKMK